jgi:hypothetical protein
LRDRKPLVVPSDQWATPAYATALADQTVTLLERGLILGEGAPRLLHAACDDLVSRRRTGATLVAWLGADPIPSTNADRRTGSGRARGRCAVDSATTTGNACSAWSDSRSTTRSTTASRGCDACTTNPTDRDTDLAALKASVRQFAERHHAPKPFIPGETPVPVTGKVYDHEEFELLLEAGLDALVDRGPFHAAGRAGPRGLPRRA